MTEVDTAHQQRIAAYTPHSEPYKPDWSDDKRFSLCDYDLDVVGEALGQPDLSEFHDQFGFRIQVKTDDDDDGESFGSDFSDQGSHIQSTSSNDHYQHSQAHSSEEDDASIGTAATTHTVTKNPIGLFQPQEAMIMHQQPSNMIPRRYRSDTDSTVNDKKKDTIHRQQNQQQQQQQWHAKSLSLMQHIRRSRSETRSSLASLRQCSPSPTSAMERPSQVFQERQSKRMSELALSSWGTGPSPSVQSKRIFYVNATSYYDMLKSKFGRSSEDHVASRESVRQAALKAEARQHLKTLKCDTSTSGKDDEGAIEEVVDFWGNFIHDPDMLFKTQTSRVKQHMVAGIPESLRGTLWQIMAKSCNTGGLENEYRELLKRISPHEKSIQRDLARTLPTLDFFQEQGGKGQELLFNVIKAYSLFDQEVGYCEGLQFIVGCLLLNMPDETAFSVLVKMMSQYGLRNQFTPNMELLQERLYQFNHLLQEMLPEVYEHLVREGVEANMYASRWLLTLFAYKCPIQLTLRVFDAFFLEGTSVLLRFALALMFRNQQTLLCLEFESLVDFLNNGVYGAYKGDENGWMQDAYHINLSPRVLTQLSKQYHADSSREAKAQFQEEQVRKSNVELAGKLRAMEKAYQTLEKDHCEIVGQVIESKMHVARVDDDNQKVRHQLAHARSEVAKLKSTMAAAHELQKRNSYLQVHNHDLQNQVTDLEAILVSLKLKYAESEIAYEEMQQRLREVRIA